MSEKTIDSFIKELQAISPNKRKLPLVIYAPNGEATYPSIKMDFGEIGEMKLGEVKRMVITYK